MVIKEERIIMGIGPRWSCGNDRDKAPSTPLWLPNPDAKNFFIRAALQVDEYLIAQIHYPNCINFEGHKVMVYKGITYAQLKARKEIDPHFKDQDKFSPIARFIPTHEGWQMAIRFVYSELKEQTK